MIRLYIYVDGSDLDDVEALLLRGLESFVQSWGVAGARVINDKFERTPDLLPEDWPEWNLGLNAEFDVLPESKVETLFRFLTSLAKESGREFVVGTWDSETQITEDWCFIGTVPDPENLELLLDLFAEP